MIGPTVSSARSNGMPLFERHQPPASYETVARYRRRTDSGAGLVRESWRYVDSLRKTLKYIKPRDEKAAKAYFKRAGESHHTAYLAEALLNGLNSFPSNPLSIPLDSYTVFEQAMSVENHGHTLDIGLRNAAIAEGAYAAVDRFMRDLEKFPHMLDRHPKAVFLMSGRGEENEDAEVRGNVETRIDGVSCHYYYPAQSDYPERSLIIHPL
jgi:hypothetical protein